MVSNLLSEYAPSYQYPSHLPSNFLYGIISHTFYIQCNKIFLYYRQKYFVLKNVFRHFDGLFAPLDKI